MEGSNISEKQRNTLNPIILNIIIGSSLVFISLIPEISNLDEKWNQPELHASIEGIGGVMCLILSVFLINKKYFKSNYQTLFLLSIVFFVVGFGNLLHSFQKPNNLFIFYHSFAGFFGGIIGMFIFFPRFFGWIADRKGAYLSIILISSIIYLIFLVFPDLTPSMGNENNFSIYAVCMNMIAGCTFLILTIKLLLINHYKESTYNYTNFSLIFMIFSVSYLTFYGSALWDLSWWIWHLYSFSLTGMVIYSVMSYQNNLFMRLNDSVISLEESKASLLRAKEVLESKNKELEQFTYITSHDLQEPLNSILSFSSLLRQSHESKLDKIGKQSVSIIEQSAIRMKEFITSLLEYSRIGREKEKTNVNIPEILNILKTDLFNLIERENASIEYIGQDLTLSAYRTDLIKLFQNLIVNGIKYRKEDESPFIVINVKELDDKYEFSITDNGIGIEEEYFDQIFEVFRRLHTRDQYEGTGIGLAHCKKIVELHHGKIWLESTPGKGSKFYFSISKN